MKSKQKYINITSHQDNANKTKVSYHKTLTKPAKF